jgi:SAM-dependent methyltransferase
MARCIGNIIRDLAVGFVVRTIHLSGVRLQRYFPGRKKPNRYSAARAMPEVWADGAPPVAVVGCTAAHERRDFAKLRVLHTAPEKIIGERLKSLCASYVSADLCEKGVDRQEDLTQMSFPDGSFDLVYCSHVLEHIKDDLAAISEVRRVLAPAGIALLPVPVISDTTVEYEAPNPYEFDHVRAPGVDYFDRYKRFFRDVRVLSSTEFDARYQLYTYEDRSCWPTPTLPNRRPSGLKHPDYVPICWAE